MKYAALPRVGGAVFKENIMQIELKTGRKITVPKNCAAGLARVLRKRGMVQEPVAVEPKEKKPRKKKAE